MSLYYPVFLNLSKKRCVVIGGGRVAERKTLALLKAGAEVTVVSETLTKRLIKEKDKGLIKHIERKFRSLDVRNAFLVVAATSDRAVNARVAEASPFLVNVADNPKLSNFIVPSVVERGPLKVAISTGGASPAMASFIKKEIEALYGKDIAYFLTFLRHFREKVLREINDNAIRRKILASVVSEDMMEIFKSEGYRALKGELLKKYRALKEG